VGGTVHGLGKEQTVCVGLHLCDSLIRHSCGPHLPTPGCDPFTPGAFLVLTFRHLQDLAKECMPAPGAAHKHARVHPNHMRQACCASAPLHRVAPLHQEPLLQPYSMGGIRYAGAWATGPIWACSAACAAYAWCAA
jgi:hypothetical protein